MLLSVDFFARLHCSWQNRVEISHVSAAQLNIGQCVHLRFLETTCVSCTMDITSDLGLSRNWVYRIVHPKFAMFSYHGKSDFVICYPLGCMVFLNFFGVPTYNFRYLSSAQLPLLGEVCYLQWWSTGFRRPITARANAFLRRLRKMLCRSCAPGQDIQMLGTRLPSRCQRQQALLPMLLQSVRGRTLLKFR
jgi:hypothetical protein